MVQELEKAAIEVTNQVGIDINKILRHEHLSHPFQFISGLGPRKAKSILETLNQRLMKLVSRRELTENKIVGKNVFTNIAGFLKVDAEGEESTDLLDITRIHPNGKFLFIFIVNSFSLDYRLAQKIAKDALDDVDQTQDFIKTVKL